jgi:hypothetical protein
LRALGPDDALPLRSQIETVLRDGAHREAAAGIAREMAAMPTLDSVVGELFACHD